MIGDFDTDDYNNLQWIYFFLASMLITIILLNMLIAIMGDTYDKVMAECVSADYKEKAELLLEVEEMITWNRKKGEKMFLHVCRYADSTQDISWEGKVRASNQRLYKLTQGFKRYEKYQKKKNEFIDTRLGKMENILSKLEAKLLSD